MVEKGGGPVGFVHALKSCVSLCLLFCYLLAYHTIICFRFQSPVIIGKVKT